MRGAIRKMDKAGARIMAVVKSKDRSFAARVPALVFVMVFMMPLAGILSSISELAEAVADNLNSMAYWLIRLLLCLAGPFLAVFAPAIVGLAILRERHGAKSMADALTVGLGLLAFAISVACCALSLTLFGPQTLRLESIALLALSSVLLVAALMVSE